jgi:UDP-2,3-diacylglucosamine pyrophosphatase LpxH
MVRRFVIFLVLLLSILTLGGCEIDPFGFFGSTDLDERWKERNTFNFLSYEDRNITLGDSYSFLVLNDTHIVNGNTRGLGKLKSVIENDSSIKFAVFNGDITQDGKRKDIEAFINTARSLGVPCYPVVGNHDIFFGNWTVWKELIGSTCYRVDGGDTTLLFLDSANAYFGSKQLDWLDGELRRAPGMVFVFTHANMFVGSLGLADIHLFTDIKERARVTSILKGRAKAMFTGHAHYEDIREIGGVQYITVEDYRDHSTYCQVSVKGNGIEKLEFKKL